ncbi:MAG: hypothetical protein FJX72_17420 [Armatimonadetes bacterium]|nr:hypothetical protein [Armatimonadota bacterium]
MSGSRPDEIPLFDAEKSQRIVEREGIKTGAALLAGYDKCRYVHCNVDGTYRVYKTATGYDDFTMASMAVYFYASVKITTVGGAEVNDNDVIALP